MDKEVAGILEGLEYFCTSSEEEFVFEDPEFRHTLKSKIQSNPTIMSVVKLLLESWQHAWICEDLLEELIGMLVKDPNKNPKLLVLIHEEITKNALSNNDYSYVLILLNDPAIFTLNSDQFPVQKMFPDLQKLLNSKKRNCILYGLKALIKWKVSYVNPELIESVREMLQHNSWEIRHQAYRCLKLIDPNHGEVDRYLFDKVSSPIFFFHRQNKTWL